MANFALRTAKQWDDWEVWQQHFPTPRGIELLVEADDMLQPAALAAARRLESAVLALKIAFEGKTYGWTDVCHRAYEDAPCASASLFAGAGPWADASTPLPTTRADVAATLATLGGTEPGLALLKLTAVGLPPWNSAVSHCYSAFYLEEAWVVGDENTNPSIEWELAFTELMQSSQLPTELTAVFFQATRSFSDELLAVVSDDLLLLIPTTVIMIGYSSAMLGTASTVRGATQYMLAASSVISPLMAVPAAWGLLGYLGLNMNVICVLAPFIALAVGIDNAFVMLSFVERMVLRTPEDVPRAIGEAMSEAGPAIFLTMVCMLVLLAFCFGGKQGLIHIISLLVLY